MFDDLWGGAEFKLEEAKFFLQKMGHVLTPPSPRSPGWHPSRGGQSMAQWQPDFFYYLDAFLGAARSIPDVIQKCFGWDKHSANDWLTPPDTGERARREEFQKEFTALYTAYGKRPLSRVRVGTFHWIGMPSVESKARTVDGKEHKGGPGKQLPVAASREFPEGTDSTVVALFSRPLPVEPSWQEFTLQMPQDDGAAQPLPLFAECKAHVEAAADLIKKAKEICDRVHGNGLLTTPPAVAREKRS